VNRFTAFSSEVATGSREENASRQTPGAPFRLRRNGKGAHRPTSSGWAVILLGVAALALGGCGRKGPLDLPPGSPQQPYAASQAETDAQREASKPSVFDPSYGANAPPAAPSKGPKRPFILDPLVSN